MTIESPNFEKALTPEEYIQLAERLSARHETLLFSGVNRESYDRLKVECDAYPEYSTHIDEIIKRMESEGMKVVVAKNKQVYILPFGSDDVVNDSIFPRHLDIVGDMDDELKSLIQAGPQKG